LERMYPAQGSGPQADPHTSFAEAHAEGPELCLPTTYNLKGETPTVSTTITCGATTKSGRVCPNPPSCLFHSTEAKAARAAGRAAGGRARRRGMPSDWAPDLSNATGVTRALADVTAALGTGRIPRDVADSLITAIRTAEAACRTALEERAADMLAKRKP
jgi:hypothetical protein